VYQRPVKIQTYLIYSRALSRISWSWVILRFQDRLAARLRCYAVSARRCGREMRCVAIRVDWPGCTLRVEALSLIRE
jgi:hypothetical protein